MAVTSEGRVALYLQDAHPIRDGMRYTQLAEERGFEAVWQAESRLVREATVPMAAFAAVTDRIKVGSGVVNNWTRNVGPAGGDVLHARRPGARPRDPGHRGVVGPAGAQGRDHPVASRCGPCGRPSRPSGSSSPWNASPCTGSSSTSTTSRSTSCTATVRRRTCRSTSAPPGMQMMELAGEIADGVVLNYLVGPAYNRTALDHLAAGAAQVRAHRGGHRPAAAGGVLARRRPRGRARPRPRAGHAVPGPAAAHHEGERRRPVAARRDRQGAHVAGVGGGDPRARCGSCRTRSCS